MNSETLQTPTTDDHGKSQAAAQYESIKEMVERLEHLMGCTCGDYEFYREDPENCDAAIKFDTEEEFEDYHNEDKARQAIDEDPLSVEVRSGWYNPGSLDASPEDFCILLCTGGPACRIRGELGKYSQPDSAWLEYQDWGTPWTQYYDAEESVLLSYAQNFYFGD